MVFTSIPAAYLDAANWQQQQQVNMYIYIYIKKGLSSIWFFILFLCAKGNNNSKDVKEKNNILVTLILYLFLNIPNI